MAQQEEKAIGDLKSEFRKRIYQLVVGGIIAVVISIAAAAWAIAKSLPDVIGLVPKGSVLAFNLENCPTGWSEFKEAWGRFVIGAVKESDLGKIPGDFRVDSSGAGLLERPFRKPGGEQAHVLSISEMPTHNHGGSTGGSSNGNYVEFPAKHGTTGSFSGNVPFSTSDHIHSIPSQGESQAHENMPPYIALSYCQKE